MKVSMKAGLALGSQNRRSCILLGYARNASVLKDAHRMKVLGFCSQSMATIPGARGRCGRASIVCMARKERSLVHRLASGNGVLYVRNFLEKNDFEQVVQYSASVQSRAKKEVNSLAMNRLGLQVPSRALITTIFHSDRLVKRLRIMLEETRLVPADYPLELRYYVPGSEMQWHKDDQLYTEPTFEAVFTIFNFSDSNTEWIDRNGELRTQWTEPNSLLLVQSQSALHRVSKIRRGERGILKLVYTTTLERSNSYERCSKSFHKKR
ncbi:hypothetical protein NDN08_006982 [Rhodosorus marinus]|uniref:Fe2OG dioxygenase domain-containing protein n=1 Tax=Rhodosorus marinus TaxID=101924 RepID=A0AAV8UMC2_9RHOD|nr:hypothetical protein NDN08_006982 [Rhodosorus marinus]